MQVGTTNTTVSDFDINIGFFPRLGLEFFPLHRAVYSRCIIGKPALELVLL